MKPNDLSPAQPKAYDWITEMPPNPMGLGTASVCISPNPMGLGTESEPADNQGNKNHFTDLPQLSWFLYMATASVTHSNKIF